MTSKSGRGRGAGPAGSRVRYGPTGRAQLIKTGGYQWSDEAEEAFFDHLAASCNVRAAAAAVGFTTFTVYRQRRTRPEFAARWKIVLEQGYARLEMALVEAAIDSVEGAEFDADRPIPRMTVEQAMNILNAHRNEVNGSGRRGPGNRARTPTLEEVRASIEKKVMAIKAARNPARREGASLGPAGETGFLDCARNERAEERGGAGGAARREGAALGAAGGTAKGPGERRDDDAADPRAGGA